MHYLERWSPTFFRPNQAKVGISFFLRVQLLKNQFLYSKGYYIKLILKRQFKAVCRDSTDDEGYNGTTLLNCKSCFEKFAKIQLGVMLQDFGHSNTENSSQAAYFLEQKD